MAKTTVSPAAHQLLITYERYLTDVLDLRPATIRNYVSDLKLFMAWCEQTWRDDKTEAVFSSERVTTPTVTRYRDYLQHDLKRKPNTVNRYLVSLKRYFCWATDMNLIPHDPTRPVKLVAQTSQPLRHLSDAEEEALITAVSNSGNLRDLTLITLMLHTGLRVSEVCHLKWEHVVRRKRSGFLHIWGKRNKYREVPLNVTVRRALEKYEEDRETDGEMGPYVFVSQRTQTRLTPRGISFLIAKYADRAGVENLRAHDLRHRFGYRMAERVPLHRLAQIMGHDSLDTTMLYVKGTQQDLQQAVETIAWE
ncbi:MAG: tyrosine-type recombinase/integrase [Anaerolineae bacterium]|nr:tyrosine-type recombinase/integrase [Anaerolineae bacterium]